MMPDSDQFEPGPEATDGWEQCAEPDATVRSRETTARSRRQHGRLRIENLPCSLGTVIDLSAGGMRVITSKLSAKKAGEIVPVELNSSRHSVVAMAEVTWGERIGFRKHIVGLRFVNLEEEQRKRICAIARAYAIRMGMGA